MQKRWKKITISAIDRDPEVLLPTFYDYKSTGLEQKDGTLEIYFPEDVNITELKKQIQQDMQFYKIKGKIAIEELKNANWHITWKKDFRPIQVAENITVIPAWMEPKSQNNIVIRIQPGMAFGTGTHATTQMAMQLLEQYFIPDCKVLDAGCGSGILTVAALKMGAKSVEAWDITEYVKDNFQEHMKINNIRNNYRLKIGDVTTCKQYPFDIILSNIQKNVNIAVLKSTIKAGYERLIIFTGILREEKQEFKNIIFQNDKQIIQTLTKDEWISFAVK